MCSCSCCPQQREHVTDYSIKKRADRLLNDVAVTLTECKIPFRRPELKKDSSNQGTFKSSSVTSVALKGVKSEGESSRLEHTKPVGTENLQSLDAFEVGRCTNEPPVEGWAVGGTPEENITTPDNNASHLAVPCCEGSSDQDMSEVEEDYSSIDLSKKNLDYVEKNAWTEKVSTENHDFVDVKKNWTDIADNWERTDRVEVHESTFQRSSKEDFIANVEEGESSMQDNCTKDEPKTTNGPAEKLVHNFDFALYKSPVTENKICTENDACDEIMSINLQHIHKEISSAEENTPELDLARRKWLPVDFSVYEESKNQLGTSDSSLTKGRSRRGSDGNVHHKDLQKSVQQTRCSGQEKTSPGVHLPNKVFCYPVELNNKENTMIERVQEDHITEKVSPDVTKADHKTSELSNDVLSFSSTRPEVPPPEIDVCRIVRNAEASKQGGYNTEESNCKNSGILPACTLEKVQVDATHTEQEQCVSESEYRIHSLGGHCKKEVCKVECCELSPQYIEGDSEVKTNVISAMLAVKELEDDVSFFRCQEVTYSNEELYILEGAKVSQGEVHDNRDIDHVCISRSEECQGKDADFDVTSTEQVCVAGVNDIQQNLSNKVSVGEDIPDREPTNIEDVVFDATDLKKDHNAVESNARREENSDNVWNMKDKKRNLENAGFNTFNTEKVCNMKCNDSTSGFNDAEQEKQRSDKVGVIIEERKHDEIEHEVYNMVDGCVTQQEVCCFNGENRSDNTRKENHTEINGEVNETDTDQECYHVDTNSYNMADAPVKQQTRSINNRTENARLKFSNQEVQFSEIESKSKLDDSGTCYSGWTSLEPCSSSAAQVQYSTTDVDGTKSSASSVIISNNDSQVKEHHLVTEDFEHVDMEISSEEDPRDHSSGSSICVDTSTSSIENDCCKPYSPSSPTWTSDEHRSPRPKDDASPYSPSHPTNVSNGDVEVCITSENVSCQGAECETNAPICKAVKVVYPEVCENNSRSRGAAEEEEILHFKQIIKGDSMSDTTPRSSRYSRSPESGAVLFESVELTKDFVDGNLPAKDLMKNRIVTTSDENRNSLTKDSEVCSDSSTSDESDKQNIKPLLRGKKRAKSLPVTVSMEAKPKVVYVTATKTYDFHTNRGTQHKPRILYATNDKSAGPARSLSLDTALGKGWPLCENSNNCPGDHDQQSKFVVETISTVEVEKRKDGTDTDGHVEPMFPDGSFISDVPLKTTKFAAHVDDDDLEVAKINNTPKSARSEEGPDNCTDCGITSDEYSVGKESLPPTCNAQSLPKSDGLLVIQPPLALRQNHVPNEHCLSTDQISIQLTGSETNRKRFNLNNKSETSGTTVTENKDSGFSDQKTSMPKSSVQPGSTVLEVEGENENDAESEYLTEIQQLVLPLGNEQTLSNSTSCSTNKRTHPESTREASRPCKVPRKPLKLIIPTCSQPAHRGEYFKKTSTSTDTRASVNLVPESNALKVLQGDVSTISEFSGDKDTVMTEKDTYSENVGLACSLSPPVSGAPAITDCPPPTCETGNSSPSTVDSPPCKTCNESNNIMPEKKANSCSGKESEWIALRMERLKKKKEEIEQVTMFRKLCLLLVKCLLFSPGLLCLLSGHQ